MLKTVFLTGSTGKEGKNFEHIMRIIFLSRFTDLTLPIMAGADFQRYLSPGTRVLRSPFSGKIGLILFSTYQLWKQRKELSSAIIITEPSVVGLVGFFAKFFSKIKWVVDVWDIPIRHNMKSNPLTRVRIKATRRLMKFVYKWADLFIVGIRPDFEFQFFQIPKDKLLCWQTTIWVPKIKEFSLPEADEDGFNILCMKSTHNYSCGVDILLQAFAEVKKFIPQARLWIIGNLLPEVEESIKPYGDMSGVEFLGFLDHQVVMKLIRRSHVCIIPWRHDVDLAQTYPTKVMEYLTEGKAVIAPRLAAIEEMIVDEENGILFQPGNSDELSEKIIKLYQDKDLRKKLKKNAIQYNIKFDTIIKHKEIFERLKNIVRDEFKINTSLIDNELK